MGARIQSIKAREIFAKRGLLGLEVTVTTDDGAVGVSTPEVGVSMGSHEMAFVLDGGSRYKGRGSRKAAENINKIIAPALVGVDVTNQLEIDRAMIELDGTPNKSKLGANAIVGVSLAAVKAAAKSAGLPLYRYIGGANGCTLPIPIYGIGSGGRYRDPGETRWFKPTFEFAAYGAGRFSTALEWSWNCAETLKRFIKERYAGKFQATYATSGNTIGTSGNLYGIIDDDRELLDMMTDAIAANGYEGKMGIYFDCAADCYYEKDIDRYVGHFNAESRTRDEQIRFLKGIVDNYPVVSLEDPLREDDFEGHAMATEALGIEIVGDDLFTTNAARLQRGIDLGAANSMVLKITQVGSVSEALAACRLCQANGYNIHPCGSRGDLDSIGDFAVGLNSGQIRGVDNNRMLEIEEELGDNAVWLGKAAYKGLKNRK